MQRLILSSFSSQEHCKGCQNPYKVLLSFIHDVFKGNLIVHLSYMCALIAITLLGQFVLLFFSLLD